MSPKQLKEEVAYVTGGTKGIGFGIAATLLQSGYRVAITGRNPGDAQQAAAQLGSEDRVLGLGSDVRFLDQEESAAAAIMDRWGRIDVVIANAGLGYFEPVDQMSLAHWNAMIDTNLSGPFHTLKATVEALKASEGYFITLASLAGTNFFPMGAGYNASKFGLVGFSQAAMLDLRPYNIKVTTIMPGSVASEFNDNVPDQSDAWKIQPEDLGQIVVDLLEMHPRTLPSKVEVRPTRPDLKG